MLTAIVNNRVQGTRITVWDVYHYLEGGWSVPRIAEVLRLTTEQVETVLKYIEENKEPVLEVHRKIEERNARGNSPEVRTLLVGVEERMQAWLEKKRAQKNEEKNGDGAAGRC